MTVGVRLKDANKLTVKPGKQYLYLACGFLVLPVLIFLVAFLPERFASDPLLDRLALVGLAALPSIYFILVHWNKRVEVDGAGITVRTLLGSERRYSWDGITAQDRTQRNLAVPGSIYRGCEIRSNGRKVVEVPAAFDGYFDLLAHLRRRGLLQDGKSA